jgi:hypothetical protein
MMNRLFTVLLLLVGAAFLLIGCASTPVEADSGENNTAVNQALAFDMAEDFTRFVFDPDIVREDGFPDHGSPFITQGYLYPAGTLDNTDGINPDGSPEFPDKVVGTWNCRGWIYGDIMNEDGLPTAVTTQIFQLGEKYSHQTIISEGFEFMAPGSVFSRAITGGTGDYQGASGQQTQEILGINEFMGMAMRFELQLEP